MDLYSKPELLFFGPDGEKSFCVLDGMPSFAKMRLIEGTADMMDWAACEF